MTNSRTEAPRQDIGTRPIDQSHLQGVFTALIPELQRAVALEGYLEATPVQEQSIPILLEGHDLMGCAQTGTGKTAAFALPILQRLSHHSKRPKPGAPRALVLAPTRELAGQINERFRAYGKYLRLSSAVIFGGVRQGPQVDKLKRGVDILVATPGRLLDLMGQGYVHLDQVEICVLDEVDRMLDMGFIPDVRRILSEVPEKRQSVFFSATLPDKMVALIRTMSSDPKRVTITPDEPTVDKISQRVLFVQKADKIELLISLLKDSSAQRVIVFTQMKHMANRVTKKLETAGISCTSIHGDKSQAARDKALAGFKSGRFQVLVATDVAARGLDVDDISHVINFDLPVDAETYVHRIGRTARAGAEGDAISLCCPDDGGYLRQIDLLLGEPVPVEHEHEFHCDQAMKSRQPSTRSFRPSRRSGGRGRGGRKR